MKPTSITGLLATLIASTSGCAALHTTPRAYTLTIDPATPGQAELCWQQGKGAEDTDVGSSPAPTAGGKGAAGGGAEKPPKPDHDCQRMANQDLTAPGTLTVKLAAQAPGDAYDLRVEQFTLEATTADARAVTAEVSKRLLTFKKQLDAVTPGAAADVTAKGDAATPLPGAKPEGQPEESAAPAERPDAKDIFTGYLVTTAGATTLLGAGTARAAFPADAWLVDTNAPALPLPPARAYVLTDGDKAYLKTLGIDDAALKTFVDGWCAPASFVAPERAAQYAALGQPVDEGALRSAIGLDAERLSDALLGHEAMTELDQRLMSLIARAQTWSTAPREARAFYLVRLGASLDQLITTCQANLAFVGSDPKGLDKLAGDAAVHADALAKVFGPIYTAALGRTAASLRATSSGHLGTLSLEPGQLTLGLGVTRDGQRTELATYKPEVLGIERLAVLVGPMVTLCATKWACFDTVEDVTVDGPRRFVRDRDQVDLGLATALHVTIAAGHKHGVGAVIGYPFLTPDTIDRSFLIGLGYRHRSRLEVAVGLHGFRTEVLRPGFEPPIVVADSNQSLTLDQLTEKEWRGGLFLMIGFAPSVFPRPQ